MLIRPTAVEARAGYRIRLRYSDGTSEEVDLSDLAGRGVFTAWNDRGFFETVHLSAGGAIAWGEDIDSSVIDYERAESVQCHRNLATSGNQDDKPEIANIRPPL